MEPTLEPKQTIDKPKPRNSYVAFFLSLIFPGLGQIYNGQFNKGIIFFCILIVIPLGFGLTRIVEAFYGLVCLVLIEVFVRIYIVIDAVYNAKKQKNYNLKPYNKWYYHFLIALAMFGILLIIDPSSWLGIQTFKIPTVSNSPTLMVGDWVVADLDAYKNKDPEYGDIVVFHSSNGQIYSFRVVGKPNDNLNLTNNIITINGKPSNENFLKETENSGIPVKEYEEVLPNGHKHLIYKFNKPYDASKSTIDNIKVPDDSYYLLGDNRDNAADSRYEGFIAKDRIIGRIIYSYWGQSFDRVNIDFRKK